MTHLVIWFESGLDKADVECFVVDREVERDALGLLKSKIDLTSVPNLSIHQVTDCQVHLVVQQRLI